jgi:glucose/arabinose dehydrogenase
MFLRRAFVLLALPCMLTAEDPAKPIVRFTPMEEAPRSIYVPLATNLHLAFDTELLRIHTAWWGDGLQLNGTPHTGSKTPFISTIQGNVFYDSRPLFPWSTGSEPELFQSTAGKSRYRELQQLKGRTSFMFEISTDSGTSVNVTQSIHPLGRLQFGFGTVFEIGPCDETIWHAVHITPEDPEMVITKDGPIAHSQGNVDRYNGTLWFAVNSDGPVKLVTKTAVGKYTLRKNVSNGGASDLLVENLDESLTHLFLEIPPHKESVSIRLVTALHSVFSSEGPYETTVERALSDLKKNETSAKTNAPSTDRVAADGMKVRPPRGDDYYSIESFPLPPEVELKVTGMDWLPNGDLAVCTWAGEVWIVENPSGDVADVSYRLFAEGLNEPMGLTVIYGEIVVAQKPELTRVLDTSNDGRADTFECINSDWDYTGNYDAFVFGPAVDSSGNYYVTLPGQRARQDVKYAGWMIRISPDGSSAEGTGSGQRVPNGLGFYGPDNDLFATDNQGNWIGACKLNHIRPGGFYGYPAATPAPPEMWDTPPDDFTPPAIWFPRTFAPSVSGIVTVPTDGFGPFGGQMLAADFQNAVVLRVQLEKVNGEWQGAVFPFVKGFESGANRMTFDSTGRLYVGGVKNKAWAASAPFEQSLERVSWKSKIPFAVKEVHAKPDGFELVFTKPQLAELAEDPESYFVSQFNYKHHQTYGSPEFDHDGNPGSATEITVQSAALSYDSLRVRLILGGLKTGYVTRFRVPDLESADGDLLWHDEFFYTLNAIPVR